MNDENVCKVVLVGDTHVGKTGLFQALQTFDIPDVVYIPTIFDNLAIEGISCLHCGTKHNISLWDTSGSEEYSRLRPLSYPDSHLVLLCFSLDAPSSIDNIGKWKAEVRKWIPECPCILVGLKSDLTAEEPIPSEKVERVAIKAGVKRYFECSNYRGKGLRDLVDYMLHLHFHECFPHVNYNKKQNCRIS